MSLHIELWLKNEFDAEKHLPDRSAWKQYKNSLAKECDGYQILTSLTSAAALPEDYPHQIAAFEGCKYVLGFCLEGASADGAYEDLDNTARSVIRKLGGVIFDLQCGTTCTADGEPIQPPKVSDKKEVNTDIVMMSWFFDPSSPVLTKAGMIALLTYLEENMPEVLPRRYGEVEPPEHMYKETGKKRLANYVLEPERGSIVFYGKKNTDFRILIAKPFGFDSNKNFRSHRIVISFATSYFEKIGQQALEKIWIELSDVIQPFYGDVRVLNLQEYEQHPVCSWWWKGVPYSLGQATVIGELYVQKWSKFKKHAQTHESLRFVSTPDWLIKTDVARLAGRAPKSIRERKGPIAKRIQQFFEFRGILIDIKNNCFPKYLPCS